MAWPTPKFSKRKVDKAGEFLLGRFVAGPSGPLNDNDINRFFESFEIIDNWRACHGYPINTFQATLRKKLKTIDKKALVAQRLKRMPSIIRKLKRFEKMKLSRMQDLGGLRAVVSNLKQLRKLEQSYKNSKFTHRLVNEKDYVIDPKNSGYRSVHLVYKYDNKKINNYNGLFIELQIRTKLQHTWATAVETMGTFLDHALKSSEGPINWLDFFSLCGSAFAFLENTKPIPKYEHLNEIETYQKTIEEANRLNIIERLQGFTIAAERIQTDKKSGSYHLIVLDLELKVVRINSYGKSELNQASKDYANVEKNISQGRDAQAVLVSAGPLDNLKRAYPSYFLDTKEFIINLNKIKRRSQLKQLMLFDNI